MSSSWRNSKISSSVVLVLPFFKSEFKFPWCNAGEIQNLALWWCIYIASCQIRISKWRWFTTGAEFNNWIAMVFALPLPIQVFEFWWLHAGVSQKLVVQWYCYIHWPFWGRNSNAGDSMLAGLNDSQWCGSCISKCMSSWDPENRLKYGPPSLHDTSFRKSRESVWDDRAAGSSIQNYVVDTQMLVCEWYVSAVRRD